MAYPRFFYDNRFGDNTPIASSTAAGNFAAGNVADWRPYTWWQPAALPASLTVDCGVAKAADYALVYGANLKSVGASVEVHGSTDNFNASDVLVSNGTPGSDDPYLLTFGSASFRYWRMLFTGVTVPSIPIASIGAVLQMPVGLAQTFDPLGRAYDGQFNMNENGRALGRIINFEQWTADLVFERCTWTFIRNTFLPAWRASLRSTPFAFAWDADNFGTEIILAAAGATDGTGFKTPHYSGSVADLQITLTGVIT